MDIAHEQTIICRSLGGFLTNEKEEKFASNDKKKIARKKGGVGIKKNTFKVVALEYFFIIGLLLDCCNTCDPFL